MALLFSGSARRFNREKQQTVRISLDLAPAMLSVLDTESERIAITRQALIKELIDDGLARRKARAA